MNVQFQIKKERLVHSCIISIFASVVGEENTWGLGGDGGNVLNFGDILG